MRGRSCPQPFLVERSAYRPDAFLLLPRWATRSPPHPPQCAHWGTFPPEGKALGGGGTAGWNLSFTNMLSNIFSLENASQIGLGIPEETAPLSYQRQRSPKRANGSERAMNPGVQGLAPGVLSPDFLPKKVGLPRRSRRGTHVAGSTLQRFQRSHLPMTGDPALFLPISREKWGPPPGRRGPRGAAPRGTGKARPPAGYVVPPPPQAPGPTYGPRRLPRRREFNIIR